MRATKELSQPDIGDITGEHLAVEPAEFAKSVVEYFDSGKTKIQALSPPTHEVVVRIGDKVVPTADLKLRFMVKTREYILEHKGVIIAASVLTVAGLLAARHNLRTREKSSFK